MTKFEQLCVAFKKTQSEFRDFKEKSHDFAVELWKQMILYFEIPATQLSLYTINEDGEYIAVAPLMYNALSLTDNAFWQVGFGITLFEENVKDFPQETLIIGIFLRWEKENLYKIKLDKVEKEFIIDNNNLEQFKIFFDFIFQEIESNYNKGLQTFLDQDQTIRKIGYKIT